LLGCSTFFMRLSDIQVKYLIQHKHLLLVDDVMTSGATLNTLAEFLLSNGASSVQNVILARTAE
jgi:predicted amidophosphoribosyltransferase